MAKRRRRGIKGLCGAGQMCWESIQLQVDAGNNHLRHPGRVPTQCEGFLEEAGRSFDAANRTIESQECDRAVLHTIRGWTDIARLSDCQAAARGIRGLGDAKAEWAKGTHLPQLYLDTWEEWSRAERMSVQAGELGHRDEEEQLDIHSDRLRDELTAMADRMTPSQRLEVKSRLRQYSVLKHHPGLGKGRKGRRGLRQFKPFVPGRSMTWTVPAAERACDEFPPGSDRDECMDYYLMMQDEQIHKALTKDNPDFHRATKFLLTPKKSGRYSGLHRRRTR